MLLSPEPQPRAETFIRAHLEGLPFQLISLHRWRAPYRIGSCGWLALLSGSLRNLADRIGLRGLSAWADRWAQRQVARWLRRVQASAVLAEYGPLGAGIAPACCQAGIPLVVIFHGYDAFLQATLERYAQSYQQLFTTAAALVVVSEPMRQQLIALGAPPGRIQVNPCGVDPSCFVGAAPALAPPHFLAVGRFVGKKGPRLTIQAFARTLAAVPLARLTMIGDGPLLPACQKHALELGLSQAIRFAGACSHAVVLQALRGSRALVQHSLRCPSGDQEGTPVALIEAQMAGLPVVSTLHAGIPSVVLDGRTGFLVPEGDVEGMAEAMIRLAENPQLAAAMGAAGRTHALAHHTLERHLTDLATTLRQVMVAQGTDQPILSTPLRH